MSNYTECLREMEPGEWMAFDQHDFRESMGFPDDNWVGESPTFAEMGGCVLMVKEWGDVVLAYKPKGEA